MGGFESFNLNLLWNKAMHTLNKTLCESDLEKFDGTTKYYSSNILNFVYTDGVQYLAERAKCYWLLFEIGISQYEKQIKGNKRLQEMQFWTLKVNQDKSAKLLCEEDINIPVFEKELIYTSFPIPEIKLWLCNMAQFWSSYGERRGTNPEKYGKLILPSEY